MCLHRVSRVCLFFKVVCLFFKATSDLDKAGELITYLSKGNSHAFKTFVAALIYTKQEHLARELDRDLTMEIKENYEEDQLPNFVLSLV